MSLPILAADLGKYKSVFCRFDPATGEARFRTVATAPDAFAAEFRREPVACVAFEPGTPAGWVRDLATDLGLVVKVANTTAEPWRWKNVKRKTDRDDALKLARLAAAGELPTVELPPADVRGWRSLIGLRKAVVGERVRVQNRLRAIVAAKGLTVPAGAAAWAAAGIAQFADHARDLAHCCAAEFWRGELKLLLDRLAFLSGQEADLDRALNARADADANCRRLATVPGIGPRTAEVIAAHLGDGTRFRTAGQVGSYAGLVPRQYQSGATDRRGRVTKRGPGILRAALVEVAWAMQRYNPWAKATYDRLRNTNGLSAKKAVVALARKVLVVCWGLLKGGGVWRDPCPPPAAAPAAAG